VVDKSIVAVRRRACQEMTVKGEGLEVREAQGLKL
jgi:hypothetical protein